MSLHELIPAITDHLKAQSIKNEIYIEQLWTFTAFSIFRGGPPPPPPPILVFTGFLPTKGTGALKKCLLQKIAILCE